MTGFSKPHYGNEVWGMGSCRAWRLENEALRSCIPLKAFGAKDESKVLALLCGSLGHEMCSTAYCLSNSSFRSWHHILFKMDQP